MSEAQEKQMIMPRKFFKTAEGKFGIEWNDGVRTAFGLKELRLACPCALCVDEHTGEKIIKDSDVAENIALESIMSIGSYAVGCLWSDGHRSGIYPYSYLRELTKSK